MRATSRVSSACREATPGITSLEGGGGRGGCANPAGRRQRRGRRWESAVEPQASSSRGEIASAPIAHRTASSPACPSRRPSVAPCRRPQWRERTHLHLASSVARCSARKRACSLGAPDARRMDAPCLALPDADLASGWHCAGNGTSSVSADLVRVQPQSIESRSGRPGATRMDSTPPSAIEARARPYGVAVCLNIYSSFCVWRVIWQTIISHGGMKIPADRPSADSSRRSIP